MPETTISPDASRDPLIELIAEYRYQSQAFEERSGDEPWDGLTEETYGPSLRRLTDSPPIPTSSQGAAAGIEFALSELEVAGDCPAGAESVLRVCIAYLRGGACA